MSALVKFLGRRGTRAKYDENKVDLPAPTEESTSVQVKSQEDKDKDADAVDKQVDTEHAAEDTDAVTNVQVPEGSKRSENGILKKTVATTSSGAPKGVYSRLWKSVTEYKLAPIRYSNSAKWIPNTLASKYIYESCAKLVGQSNHALKHEREFLPYAFITGMFYLQHIQVLRAKKASGDLSGEDASALARFEKFNPPASIMIPEPCIPTLEALSAVKLDDIKYKWVLPDFGLNFNDATSPRATFQAHCNPELADLIRANVPFMLAMLAQFGATDPTDISAALDGARRFIPVQLGPRGTATAATTVRFLGGDVSFNGVMAGNLDRRNVLQMHGANVPFQFYNANYLDAHEGIRSSRFFIDNGIDIGITNTVNHPDTGNALNDGTKTMNSLETYLFIGKRNNPSWFQYLTKQINTVARHFPGSKPFSQIGVIGGIEPSVIAQLKLEDPLTYTLASAAANSDNYVYQDIRLNHTNYNTLNYYRDPFRTLNASFSTTRGDVHRNEELNSFALATCADPPIELTDTNRAVLRSGRFFDDIIKGGKHMQVQRLGFTDVKIPGEVPMYHYLDEDFVKPVFSKTPSNQVVT